MLRSCWRHGIALKDDGCEALVRTVLGIVQQIVDFVKLFGNGDGGWPHWPPRPDDGNPGGHVPCFVNLKVIDWVQF